MFRQRVCQCLKLLQVFLLIQMKYYPTKGQNNCPCIGCDFNNVPAIGNEEDECNIENVSLMKHAYMSSQWVGMPAEDAVNGITSGQYRGQYDNNCASTGSENNPWWEVDLGRAYTISSITIFTMDNAAKQMQNVQILIDGQLCNTLCKSSWDDVQHVDMMYTTPRYGRLVKLIRNFNDSDADKYISICEVQVWVQKCSCASVYAKHCVPEELEENCHMENVAVGKKAYMSSSHETGNPGQACVAVDGNTTFMQSANTDTPSPSCTYSGNSDTYAWWEVDLGDDYAIKRISVYTTPQFVEKLSGVEISVDGNVLHYIAAGSEKVEFMVNCSHFCRGRRVMLNATRAYYLVICEVQVWVCTPGYYGVNCTLTCGHCTNGPEDCDSVSGVCPSGCQSGWQLANCSEPCNPGYYGVNCSTPCGHCTNGPEVCDIISGVCPSGCQFGWHPPNCNESCNPGSYGINCSTPCGHCANGPEECDIISGVCPSGCQSGWHPPNCNETCVPGYYGANCSTPCGHCTNGPEVCDNVSGVCPSGCQSGWHPPNCNESCIPGYYGVNCSTPCGHCTNGPEECDMVSGVCPSGCQIGWHQPNCNESCIPGYYGVNCSTPCGHCTNGPEECDSVSGVCPSGCQSGWHTPNCNESCIPGYYGGNCSKPCGNCTNGPLACDRISGECLAGCQSGWQPPTCTNEWVFHQALNISCGFCLGGTSACNKTTGNCISGCDSGWYMLNCKNSCGSGCQRNDCDISGECICMLGWKPPLCSKKCDSGSFGQDCSMECGHCLGGKAACNTTTGSCLYGCMNGWYSQMCDKTSSEQQGNSDLIGAVVGAILGAGLLIAGAILTALLIWFRKFKGTGTNAIQNTSKMPKGQKSRNDIQSHEIQPPSGVLDLEKHYDNIHPNGIFTDDFNIQVKDTSCAINIQEHEYELQSIIHENTYDKLSPQYLNTDDSKPYDIMLSSST